MKTLAVITLTILQIILAVVLIWQVIGLLPILSWIGKEVGAGHWFLAGLKVAMGLVAAGLFWVAGRVRKRIAA